MRAHRTVALALAACAAAALIAPAGAAEEGWTLTSEANVTLTQNAYSDNWEGSEVGSVSWAFGSNTSAERQATDWLNAKGTLKLAFGQTHSQDQDTKEWLSPVKSTDLVDLETIFRVTRGWAVDPFASFRAKTQFLDERDPDETLYLNPATYTETVGVARMFIKDEKRELSARLGGSVLQEVDRSDYEEEDDDGDDDDAVKSGIEFVAEYRTPLAGDRMAFSSRLGAFKAFYNSKADDLEGLPEEDYWREIDVDWENKLTASITDYVMVNLYMQLLYDREVDEELRLKETLSLGLTFNLI